MGVFVRFVRVGIAIWVTPQMPELQVMRPHFYECDLYICGPFEQANTLSGGHRQQRHHSMDHSQMDHGDMDMGGDQCSMNV